MTECIPARKKNGEIAKGGTAFSRMYEALEGREGPRPPNMVCRHLCENDSQAHKRENGFVCVLHTTWGTVSENMMDKPSEIRSKKRALSPNAPMQKQRTCPHCGKLGAGPGMIMWHFDKCRSKP